MKPEAAPGFITRTVCHTVTEEEGRLDKTCHSVLTSVPEALFLKTSPRTPYFFLGLGQYRELTDPASAHGRRFVHLPLFVPHKNPFGGSHHHAHFTDEETVVQ